MEPAEGAADDVAASHGPEVARFWQDFCAQHGLDAARRHDVYAFGDSPELADELLELVLHGPKRATAGLLADYDDGEPMPEAGTLSVLLDGAGRPRCVVRTTEVVVKPLVEVDAAFAWDEGEGDRTRESWLADHRAYFGRERAARGLAFSDEMPAVFERFELVWVAPAGTPGEP